MSAGMEKGIKFRQDQSSMMLLFEHNFRYNAVVLSIMLKFSSMMYLTLERVRIRHRNESTENNNNNNL